MSEPAQPPEDRPDPARTVTIRFAPEDIAEASRLNIRRHLSSAKTVRRLATVWVAFSLLLWLFLWLVAQGDPGRSLLIAIAAITALIFIMLTPLLSAYVLAPWLARRQLRQQPALGRSQSFRWNPDGFRLTGDTGETRLPWRELVRVHEDRDLFLFYLSDMIYHALPKRFLSPAQAASVRECWQEGRDASPAEQQDEPSAGPPTTMPALDDVEPAQTITIQLTADDMADAARLHVRHSMTSRRNALRMAALWAAGVVLVLAMIRFLGGPFDREMIAIVALEFVVVIAAVVLLSFLFAPRRGRREFHQRRSMQRAHSFGWNRRGIRKTSENGGIDLPWSDLVTMCENRSTMLFYVTDRLYHIAPKRLLSAEQIASIRQGWKEGRGEER